MSLSIQFLGAAGTVTGSKYLLDNGSSRVLVDCGLYQGLKELRLQNWAPFPVAADSIDAVILTHAHLDHTGYLPLLVRQGFRGPVYATAPTRDLSRLILLDSAHLQTEDADFANRHGYSKHRPAEALYSDEDVRLAMSRFEELPLQTWEEILPGWKLRLQKSGHILGSTFVELEVEGKRTVFSGDLGRQTPLTLDPPAALKEADYLLIESTYGDRIHPAVSPFNELAKIVADTVSRRGHLLIPSFAVGRTQDLLFLLSRLKKANALPKVPVYLDSPLGIRATSVFAEHSSWHRLTAEDVRDMQELVTLVESPIKSKGLLELEGSSVVIAGSGMLSGGRILHHLRARVGDPKNMVALVGFQPSGTRGRHLKEGAAELKIYGNYYPVRAEVRELTGLSAHADQREILAWLSNFKDGRVPKNTFIVHGEPHSADALRVRIQDSLGWACEVAKPFQKVQLC
jgi:metallo-beta-lactamase family protein